jgi:hypothetical protein
MKKFKISLGVLLQQNYEVEIEAENEEEAIKLGIEAFKDGDERGEIVDFAGAEAEENFDEDTKSGISAEEVERYDDNLFYEDLFYEDGKRWVKIG